MRYKRGGLDVSGPVTNILIVGVGGQGTLLASRVLARAVISTGADVKVSEVHGMSQRGGSVVTQVRFGKEVFSPLIETGAADAILAFEKLEALRWLPYLKEGGRLIINDLAIDPLPVLVGTAKYPEDCIDQARAATSKVDVLNATDLAGAIGEQRAANMVLLGALSCYLDIADQHWIAAITETVPAKAREMNIKAFEAGRAASKK